MSQTGIPTPRFRPEYVVDGLTGDYLTNSSIRVMFPVSVSRAFIQSRPYHSALKSVTQHDIAHFSKILTPSAILSTLPPSSTPPEELIQYNTDWMGKYRGYSTTILKPKTTQQVSEIVKWCNEKRIGIVPQGGNTGLVGGSVPVKDEIILSLANMTTVRSFDPVSGTIPS